MNPTNLSGDELVGYWRLDETNGLTAADSSSAGNDGSVSGAAIVEGYIRNGRSLDGVNDSITITNAADYKPVAPLSIAACVNLSTLYGNSVTGSVDDGHMILAAQKNAGDGYGYALYKTERNSLVFEVANSSVTNAALIETADGFVVTGRWYYIVATFDGSNLALYADNDLVGTTQYSASLEYDTETGLVIGHGVLADDGYVAGVLDEIRVYSMALGPDQIEAIDYAAQDSDNDGFANYEESIHGTSPTNSDTDGDGLSDYDEINVHNTNPNEADTDGDGIPDDGEIDLGLDPNDDTDAALDPDSDNLTNLEEYENGTDISDSDSDDDGLSDGDELNTHGTNPLSGDTDSDGLPDKWEVDNGTDPDVADASDDPDEDRLINTDEYNEGTLPLDADTDDDGVNDWVEVEHAFSDPLTADFDGSYTNVYELDGADANAALGSWGRWDTEAYSRGRRGGLGYTNILTVSQAGVHRIEVEAYGQYMYDAKLIAYVDGQYVGYNFLLLSGGATNTTHFFSPWLTNGNHSLIVFWDNVFDAPTLNITAVRVQEVGGPDGNGNGVADWIDNRFGNMCSIDSLSVTSRFSPYCMEGKARHLGMMTISGAVGPEHGAGRRWYADVPLSSGSPTNVVVSFQDGGLTSTSTVMWAEFNILGESDTAVRVGDSLLLTAVPAGATNGTVEIEIVGVTNYLTDVVSPVAHEFGGTGIFTVVGTHDNGSVSSNSLEVEVIDAAFPTNVPAAWWGKTRTVECPQVPLSGVVVEGDEDTTVGELQPRVGSGAKFSLRIGESDEQRYLAVRLGQDGPVLDSTPIAGFWVRSVIDGYYYEIAVQEDGSRVIQDTLVMGYLPESVTIKMNIVVGSATFDDGTILRTLAVDDLSDVGEYVYRMIVPSGQTAPCHYVSAHQGGVNIGQ